MWLVAQLVQLYEFVDCEAHQALFMGSLGRSLGSQCLLVIKVHGGEAAQNSSEPGASIQVSSLQEPAPSFPLSGWQMPTLPLFSQAVLPVHIGVLVPECGKPAPCCIVFS